MHDNLSQSTDKLFKTYNPANSTHKSPPGEVINNLLYLCLFLFEQ